MKSTPLTLDFTRFLRECVLAQDRGRSVAEELTEAGFGLSLVASLMDAAHIERLRMVHEGLDVIAPPTDGTDFVLGFAIQARQSSRNNEEHHEVQEQDANQPQGGSAQAGRDAAGTDGS